MLWTLVVVLFVLWVLGLSLKIAGGLIHVLLVIALVIILVRLPGRRSEMPAGAIAVRFRTGPGQRHF